MRAAWVIGGAMALALGVAACAGGPADAPPGPSPAGQAPRAQTAPAEPPPPLGGPSNPAAAGQAPSAGAPTGSAEEDGVSVFAPETERPAPPAGESRSPREIMAARRSWNNCIARVERATADAGPSSPVLDSPEDICARQLGMRGPGEVPNSRR